MVYNTANLYCNFSHLHKLINHSLGTILYGKNVGLIVKKSGMASESYTLMFMHFPE